MVNDPKRPPGEPGEELMRRARQINFSAEDLAEMEAAIQDLEEIDPDDWDLSDTHVSIFDRNDDAKHST
jgi:hypothetical protein